MREFNAMKGKKDLEFSLKSDYAVALKDDNFKKLVNTLKVKEDVACKYTSKLERTVEELQKCANCKSLLACQNKVTGMVYYPSVNDDGSLEFNYVACKYKKKDIKDKEGIKSNFFQMPYDIKMAKMANIELETKRARIIKWLKKFYDSYQKDEKQKGLYLYGSFGSGKTYMISALLNELSRLNYSVVIVYYPELIRSIKESFSSGEDFYERMNMIKTCDLLL